MLTVILHLILVSALHACKAHQVVLNYPQPTSPNLPQKCLTPASIPCSEPDNYKNGFPAGPLPDAQLPLQVYPLIVSGPPENRIDLIFFSDGYVESELPKFLEDSMRLAEDLCGNQTFKTVMPLLNFWADFSPSKESGIGGGAKPKDTVFGLYRDGTELRGVYCSKEGIASDLCSSLGARCDYPILLGNDPLYGGLSTGKFTIVTSSLLNGPLVLRHELGHTIIGVGEEYDGGDVYYGVNAAQNLSGPLPWAHWLTNSSVDSDLPRVERSVMPLQAYPWSLLNTSTPWSYNFTSAGTYSHHLVKFSLSGLPDKTDLAVEFDGIPLDWIPRINLGLDRWHYDIPRRFSLTPGEHQIRFTLLNPTRQGVAQLCSVEVLEFGNEFEFEATPSYYGIFPTFSINNATTYRPTNDDCVMHTTTLPNFCKVCLEGLWLSLLRQVDFIDELKEDCHLGLPGNETESSLMKTIEAKLVPLAQLRNLGKETYPTESYTIAWYKDGQILGKFTNRTVLELNNDELPGNFSLSVKFSTDEVRQDKAGLLERKWHFSIFACEASDFTEN